MLRCSSTIVISFWSYEHRLLCYFPEMLEYEYQPWLPSNSSLFPSCFAVLDVSSNSLLQSPSSLLFIYLEKVRSGINDHELHLDVHHENQYFPDTVFSMST